MILSNPAPDSSYSLFPTCLWDSAVDLPGVSGLSVDLEVQVTDGAHADSCGVPGVFVTNP